MKKLYFLIACFWASTAYAQENIPVGTWRTHLSYNRTVGLALAGDITYCATENGFFAFDKTDNSISKFSVTEGLSDNGLSSIAYDAPSALLVIGYQSGNIDLIQDNTVTNIDEVKNASINNDKDINHIRFDGNLAYISTGFGMLLFDLNKLELNETIRNLGGNEDGIEVVKSTVFQDSIFLATEQGVMAAPKNGVNLLDFNNWKVYGPLENAPNAAISSITLFNDEIVASVDNDGLYRYNGTMWIKDSLLQSETFQDIEGFDDQMLVSLEDRLVSIDENWSLSEISYITDPEPVVATLDDEQSLWVADGIHGLVSNTLGGFEAYFPSGPFSDNSWQLYYNSDQTYSLSGGYGDSGLGLGRSDGYSVFDNGVWDNFTPSGAANSFAIPAITDIVDAAYNPANGNLYLASFGYGLLVQDADGSFSTIDDNTTGSPLENLNSDENQVNISALTLGNEGLWIGNHGAINSVHLLNNEGNWESFTFGFTESRFPVQIAITADNNKWVRLNPNNGGGILVFNNETGQNTYLTDIENSGGLPDEKVYDIAIDRDGLVWAATDNGIAYFANPFEVLSSNTINAFVPRFEGRDLFDDEVVTSVAIDGGNRKWIATTDGVWLFNSFVDELIYNFNTENSPLLSNNVMDIAINDNTGEVFFATDRGVVSFRGTSTASTPLHGGVKIFPNPVTREFSGLVGISGLATDAIVKITDISGKLIWQTRAAGGTATWNVSDYNGDRAETGIYIVFSATDDGTDTFIGKIAVVN